MNDVKIRRERVTIQTVTRKTVPQIRRR
jgi:hypothetical protein